MNNTFVTHPSVRIKGTENNYNPVQCFEALCQDKSPHMHCPFCNKNECYTDPVILKAHYRVKHVDKGIDFAGLKVLRCCDQCDIVGVIKGEKKFKGAHWHCYKCRNGFNRRDEAIKHYKTHFRNPQTTFQIQIAQEVNQSLSQGYENEDGSTTIASEEFSVQSIHPVLTEAITCMTTGEEQGFTQSSMPVYQRTGLEGSASPAMPGVGAVETVGVTDTQTIMIIQEDGSFSALPDAVNSQDISTCTNESTTSSNLVEDGGGGDGMAIVSELQQRVHNLELERAKQEKTIQELRKKVEEQAETIVEYKGREQELLSQLNMPTDRHLQDVCDQLAAKHKQLIHEQLTQLKRSFLQSTASNMIIVNGPLNGALSQQIALQALNPTDSDGSAEDVRIHFQPSNSENVITVVTSSESVSEAPTGIVSVNEAGTGIVSVIESGTGVLKCQMDDTSPGEKEHAGFEMLQQEFTTDSLDEERLQIEDENIPIENDGQEPPLKRAKVDTDT